MSPALRRLATSAVLTVLLAAPAAASEPATEAVHLAAATRLAEDTGGTVRISKLLGSIRGVMIGILVTHGKDSASAGRIVDELLLPAFRSHLPELTAGFAQFWARSMTTQQLDTADAFFRSPTGRRMVEVQLDAAPALLAIGQAWGERVGREVLTTQRDALRQRGVSL